MKTLTVGWIAGISAGDVITLPAGPWPWYTRLWAFLRRKTLPPRENVYTVSAVADDHTLAVEEFP